MQLHYKYTNKVWACATINHIFLVCIINLTAARYLTQSLEIGCFIRQGHVVCNIYLYGTYAKLQVVYSFTSICQT